MNEKRLQVLEELAAHQARTIEELSTEVAIQTEKITRLEDGIKVLAQRFSVLEADLGDTPADQKPPHW